MPSICSSLDLSKTSSHADVTGWLEDELLLLFHRCHMHMRTTDCAASVAVQKANIATLQDLGRPLTEDDYFNLDGASQIRIGLSSPTGIFDATSNGLGDNTFRMALDEAASTLKMIKPGRPKQTDSLARKQFALGLAAIYKTIMGRNATRIFVTEPGARGNTEPSYERGPFLDFVTVIIDALPLSIGHNLRPNQVGREAIKIFKRLPSGLLEDSDFIGKTK